MKPRLPLLSEAVPERVPRRATDTARASVGRALVGVCDRSAPELALRFAERLIAALHEGGRRSALLLAADDGRTREGDARRLRVAGAEPVIVLAESELPVAAQRALAALPSNCVVVALGSAFVAQLSMLFTVRVSRVPASSMRDADGIDLELGPGMEGTATLIGDWLADCVTEVSTRGFARRE